MQSQARFDGLAPLAPAVLHERRERVFLLLAGLFLGTLAMLNILGVTRFIYLGEMSLEVAQGGWLAQMLPKMAGQELAITFAVAVGVLPYPMTFLCTDLISEFYGRRRANWVVFVGLILNIWVIFILWLGGLLPGWEAVDPQTGELARDAAGRLPLFYEIRVATLAAVGASMLAYLAAQFIDVQVFHFWKRLTGGRALWLRNNGSTLVSQLVDTVAVILITYLTFHILLPDNPHGLPMDERLPVWFNLTVSFILAGYVFKVAAALLDTIPIYIAVHYLSRYLRIDPRAEHRADAEEAQLDSA